MIGEIPSKRVRLSVLKLQPNVPYTVVLACEEVFSFHTHWLGKRSYMCPGVKCPACEQGVGAKWCGIVYVMLLHHANKRSLHGLLELTEAAYYRLRDFAELSGQSVEPGLTACIGRRSRRAPLHFQHLDDLEMIPKKVPTKKVEEIANAVATLYSLPSIEEKESVTAWSQRATTTAATLLNNQLRSLL